MIESQSPLYDAFKGILNTIDKNRVQELLTYMNTEAINFNLFKNNAFIERKFPFDIIPRVVSAQEFAYLEKGIQQRIYALNLFLKISMERRKFSKMASFLVNLSSHPKLICPRLPTRLWRKTFAYTSAVLTWLKTVSGTVGLCLKITSGYPVA